MIWNIRARFEDGVFKPQERCDVQEGAEVNLRIDGAMIQPPQPPLEPDLAARRANMERLIADCLANPWPNARKLTRDEMHERG